MTNLIDDLNNSYKTICSNSKYVNINYEKINDLIINIDNSKIKYWLDDNPFNILDIDTENIINFLLIYHTIGDYCFWGNPKWEVLIDDNKRLDGTYAIIYVILKNFEKIRDTDLTYNEFKELLKGNVEIPFLRDRYNNLVYMKNFISCNNFYEKIKNYTKDYDLLNYLVKNLPYLNDYSIYNNIKVSFYKRAQLFTSDILHIFKIKRKVNVDYSNLVGCADYKIPQVMYCYDILEYSKELKYLVDNKIEIKKDSIYELEIRANCLFVINYIYEKINKKCNRMDINDYVWLFSQNKNIMTKNYHLILTNKY